MAAYRSICSIIACLIVGQTACVGAQQCASTPPLTVRGKHFFQVEGSYHGVKGIAYYPRPNAGPLDINNVDLFTDEYEHIWRRDIEMFKTLNINTIRIYAVDPGKNHDNFMCALQQAGIYVIVGLSANCPNCAITTDSTPECYPAELKTRGEYIISEFSQYNNVMAFSAGNEIGLLPGAISDASYNTPCVKKFIRDMRTYIAECNGSSNMRQIPVGIVIADADIDDQILYLSCRSDPDDVYEDAEWYGLNAYRHCDGSATDASNLPGYQQLLSQFSELQVPSPVIFTEFGCLSTSFPTVDGYEGQRTWLDVETMFLPEYLEEFTGGIAFEYSTERQNSVSPWPFTEVGGGNFGIAYFEPEECNDVDIPCSVVEFPQFQFLSQRYAAVNVASPPSYDGRPEVTVCPADIPSIDAFVWEGDSTESWYCPIRRTVTCPACEAYISHETDMTGSEIIASDTENATSTASGGSSLLGYSAILQNVPLSDLGKLLDAMNTTIDQVTPDDIDSLLNATNKTIDEVTTEDLNVALNLTNSTTMNSTSDDGSLDSVNASSLSENSTEVLINITDSNSTEVLINITASVVETSNVSTTDELVTNADSVNLTNNVPNSTTTPSVPASTAPSVLPTDEPVTTTAPSLTISAAQLSTSVPSNSPSSVATTPPATLQPTVSASTGSPSSSPSSTVTAPPTTLQPTAGASTGMPSDLPTITSTNSPTLPVTSAPSKLPTSAPSRVTASLTVSTLPPTVPPSSVPSAIATTTSPTVTPSSVPTSALDTNSTATLSANSITTLDPQTQVTSAMPSSSPTMGPALVQTTLRPTISATGSPSGMPTTTPSMLSSIAESLATEQPTLSPTTTPASESPTNQPTLVITTDTPTTADTTLTDAPSEELDFLPVGTGTPSFEPSVQTIEPTGQLVDPLQLRTTAQSGGSMLQISTIAALVATTSMLLVL